MNSSSQVKTSVNYKVTKEYFALNKCQSDFYITELIGLSQTPRIYKLISMLYQKASMMFVEFRKLEFVLFQHFEISEFAE